MIDTAGPSNDSWEVDEDGVLHGLVVSDGKTGEGWIATCGVTPSQQYCRRIFLSPSFVPTSGVRRKIVIVSGDLLSDTERTIEKIWELGKSYGLVATHPEVAGLLFLCLNNDEPADSGFQCIVTMHRRVNGAGERDLLHLTKTQRGERYTLKAYFDKPGRKWPANVGFAFEEKPQ